MSGKLAVIVGLFALAFGALPNFTTNCGRPRYVRCLASLQSVDVAKEHWAMTHKKGLGTPVRLADLTGKGGYLKSTPICPLGGTYLAGRIGEMPLCSLYTPATPARDLDDLRTEHASRFAAAHGYRESFWTWARSLGTGRR
jgi:hypothetical protein